MPIQSVEPRRLYRQIADQIRALIRAKEFPPGSRLPPERDLARQLGVSRPSVREALIALEVEGLVEVRIGSGIYVLGSRADGAAAAEVTAGSGPFELLRARRIIEGECAALAARAARKPQLAAMAEALEQMRQIKDVERRSPLGADRLFHLRVAEATGNGALVAVVKMLWEERTSPLFTRLEHHYDTLEAWDSALAEHRLVLAALSRRDAEGARAAMQRHLDRAYRRLSRSWDTQR
jgi:DNA-binding FadR family transcriptional regulator